MRARETEAAGGGPGELRVLDEVRRVELCDEEHRSQAASHSRQPRVKDTPPRSEVRWVCRIRATDVVLMRADYFSDGPMSTPPTRQRPSRE